MGLQLHVKNNHDRLYNPDRDLAYCGPHILHRAMLGLDSDKQEEWIKQVITDNKITDDELEAAARIIAEYMNAVRNTQFVAPVEALTSLGFFELRGIVQTVVCAKIGQITLSLLFTSMRDADRGPHEEPYDVVQIIEDIEAFLAAVKAKSKKKTWLDWLKDATYHKIFG